MSTITDFPILPPSPCMRARIPRDAHPISRKDISPNALRVLYRLREGGFGAFLVGGAVRDLLVGGHPKDFDVATSATPEQVKALFRNCRLIGRRFRLAHVVYGREIIEVATFRSNVDDGSGDRETHEGGRLLRDNVYGTIEEDAIRRDFTANALYYAIEDFSVRDYVGGYEDVQARVLRLIGDPETRYREDPVRMLRAVRLAAKLDFTIEPGDRRADSRARAAAARIRAGAPVRGIAEAVPLRPCGREFRSASNTTACCRVFLPETAKALAVQSQRRVASHADRRPAQHRCARGERRAGVAGVPLRRAAVARVLPRPDAAAGAGRACGRSAASRGRSRHRCTNSTRIALPRRFSLPMQEIWLLQSRFSQRQRKRVFRLLSHPRFRAAFDFLQLRQFASPRTRRRHRVLDATCRRSRARWSPRNSKRRPSKRPRARAPRRRRRRRRPTSDGGATE